METHYLLHPTREEAPTPKDDTLVSNVTTIDEFASCLATALTPPAYPLYYKFSKIVFRKKVMNFAAGENETFSSSEDILELTVERPRTHSFLCERYNTHMINAFRRIIEELTSVRVPVAGEDFYGF